MDSTYAGSYGRLKVHTPDFLDQNTVKKLLELQTLDDITKSLSATSYREDIDALSAIYKNPELLEMSISRHLTKKNKIAMMATPPIVNPVLKIYFSKWDIENIKTILSSKLLGYTVKETEVFLLSFRDVPLGMLGGYLKHDDYRALLTQTSIESIVTYLAPFEYGTYLLQYMDQYRKSGDISILFSALDNYYYVKLLNSLKFYRGDEGPLFRYFKEEIDSRNITMIMKAKDLDVSWDSFAKNLLDLGNLTRQQLEELYKLQSIEELVSKVKGMYDIMKGVDLYLRDNVLYGFEIELKRKIFRKYEKLLVTQSLSLGAIFNFIFAAENERELLRFVVMGKQYKLPLDSIKVIMEMGENQ